ncbi:MAG TPA: GAF and ANTAR domain-containing protein [Pseudonocardia sp.]|nr:GAF and ANTAR domain-containing protein [Pseudonocardia sp.]
MDDESRQDLAQRMSILALRLQDEDNRADTLRVISHTAADLVPGTTWAGISLIEGRRVTVEAPTHSLVIEIEHLQKDLGDGPTLSAIQQQRIIGVPDFTKPDQPWPTFADRAVELGVRAMLSLPLAVHREILGSLNLYAAESDAFTYSETIAELVARHAAIALAGVTHAHHLTAALINRDVLGQAKGILMQRDGLTAPQAFEQLVRLSQNSNIKVADVAHQLVTDTENHASDDHRRGSATG